MRIDTEELNSIEIQLLRHKLNPLKSEISTMNRWILKRKLILKNSIPPKFNYSDINYMHPLNLHRLLAPISTMHRWNFKRESTPKNSIPPKYNYSETN